MTHIANRRIKMGGTYYAPGDPIELTEDDLAGLPEGAVVPASDVDEPPADPVSLDTFLRGLGETAFRKDGDLRSEPRRELVAAVGEDPGDEAITAALTAIREETQV